MELSGHKKLIVTVCFILSLSFLILSWDIYRVVKAPLRLKNNDAMIISLDRTASAYQFVRILKEHQLIDSTKLLLLMIRTQGLAHQLKAGVYQIKPGETASQLLDRVVKGDVVTQNFPIIAGTTQQKIAKDLILATYLEYHPEDWSSIKEAHPNAEGLVLADTYQYRGGSRSNVLLDQAHQNLMNYLGASWSNRIPDLPYRTPYELLIAASRAFFPTIAIGVGGNPL